MEQIAFGMPETKIEDEATAALVDAVVDSPEFQEWLDIQIQRGDHYLADRDHFRWDDIPKPARPGIRRMLAMRMLELKRGLT